MSDRIAQKNQKKYGVREPMRAEQVFHRLNKTCNGCKF